MTVVTRAGRVGAASWVLLLPPSEGKATGGGEPSWSPDLGTFGELLDDRRAEVLAALTAADGGDAKLLGVSGRHLDRARGANLGLLGAPTLPAWQRYTGVVWDHLDPAGLTPAQRRSIVVVSGLHGLVRADDPVPDYRLKMGASLPPMKKLSTWWRPVLADVLVERLGDVAVVDLLPQEHRAALTVPRTGHLVPGAIVVDLVERSGASGGHAAKAAKGRLARHLLTSGGTIDEALASWSDDRFVLDVTIAD